MNVSIYPGSFKPPHKAHFNIVKNIYAESDKVIIFISEKGREGIEIEQSLNVWNHFKKYIGENIDIIVSCKSPVYDTYKEIKSNPNNNYKVLYGKNDKRRFQDMNGYNNVTIIDTGNIESINATDLRKLLRNNESIRKYIPESIPIQEYKNILYRNED